MNTRKRRSLSAAVVVITLLASSQSTAQRESGTESQRVIVVFRAATLPSDRVRRGIASRQPSKPIRPARG